MASSNESAMAADAPWVALRAELETQAMGLGFARFGVADAAALEKEGAQLSAWLAAGNHGDMRWMAETEGVRKDVRHKGMLPEAKSVIALATPYAVGAADAGGSARAGQIARYAQGRDYHTVLGKRVRKLVKRLRERGFEARGSVDAMPVMERAWAQRAGIGFVGKNCCLIVPGIGSHVFLSVVVTSAKLPANEAMKSRCGECRLCLDACPTEAFQGPHRLDARRCISYLTIEHRGEIAAELEADMGNWLFGCDACQDCCPFNHGRGKPLPRQGPEPFLPHARWQDTPLEAWLTMSEAAFRETTEGSPLRRATRDGMARNSAIVLGNGGGKRALPVLQEAAKEHPSPTVRDAAKRAAARLRE